MACVRMMNKRFVAVLSLSLFLSQCSFRISDHEAAESPRRRQQPCRESLRVLRDAGGGLRRRASTKHLRGVYTFPADSPLPVCLLNLPCRPPAALPHSYRPYPFSPARCNSITSRVRTETSCGASLVALRILFLFFFVLHSILFFHVLARGASREFILPPCSSFVLLIVPLPSLGITYKIQFFREAFFLFRCYNY